MHFTLPGAASDTAATRKLDRMDWTAHSVVQAYGVRLGLRANQSDALARMLELLPPGWKAARGTAVTRVYSWWMAERGRFHQVFSNAERIARVRKTEQAADTLQSSMQLFVAEHARRRVFIHAGVVGWRGQAIVIPGHSMSGKSTLVEALVRAGAEYYSDEYAVLDDAGRVHPFLRPPQRRDAETFRQTSFSIESIGGKTGQRPLPIRTVLVSEYQPGAVWRPRPLTAGRGVLALLQHAVAARTAPERVLPVLTQVAHAATILKSVRGETAQMVEALLAG